MIEKNVIYSKTAVRFNYYREEINAVTRTVSVKLIPVSVTGITASSLPSHGTAR